MSYQKVKKTKLLLTHFSVIHNETTHLGFKGTKREKGSCPLNTLQHSQSVYLKLLNTWPSFKLPEINYKFQQVFRMRGERRPSEIHIRLGNHGSWNRAWAQAITAWLSTHHIINPNHSKWKYTLITFQPHLPSATTNCWFHTLLLIGLILLIELHLRNMWESRPGSLPRLHAASHFALAYYHNKHLQ